MERPRPISTPNSYSSKSSSSSIPTSILNASSATTTTAANSARPLQQLVNNPIHNNNNNNSSRSSLNTPTILQESNFDILSPPTYSFKNKSSQSASSSITSKNNDSVSETNRSTESKSKQPKCNKCHDVISKGQAYELGGDVWHVKCFSCYKCSKNLDCDSDFLVLSTGSLICSDCSDCCKVCNSKIDDLAIILSNSNEAYCPDCFRCYKCNDKITNLKYAKTKKGLFCINCHEKLIERRKQHVEKKSIKESTTNTRRNKKELPTLPPPSKKDNESTKIITADNTNITKQFLLPSSSSSLGLALSTKYPSDENTESDLSPPWRSPNRTPNNISSQSIHNMSSLLLDEGSSFQNTSGNTLAEAIDFSDTSKQPPTTSLSKSFGLEKLHSRNPSWTSPIIRSSEFNPSLPNVYRSEQNGSRKSSSNGDRVFKSHSRNNSLNNDLNNYRDHSRKASIDDILESTLENNAEDEKIFFLNRTPLRNTAIPRSPNRNVRVYDDMELGSEDKYNRLSVPLERLTNSSTANDLFLTANNTGDNTGTLKEPQPNMTTPASTSFPVFEDQVENVTIGQEPSNITNASVSTSATPRRYESSIMNTPKKIGRSLSLKSPKKLFQSFKSSSHNTPSEIQQPQFQPQHQRHASNSSNAETHSGWGVRSSNFSISRTPPVPSVNGTRLRTHQKSRSSTGNSFTISGPIETNNEPRSKANAGMYSANATNPLSEQTLMDGNLAALKLQQELKQYNVRAPPRSHHRNTSASSSNFNPNHQRMLSGDSNFSLDPHSKNGIPKLPDYGSFIEEYSRDVNDNSNSNYVEDDEEESIRDSSLQLRSLRLEIIGMETSKKELQREIENLQKQKERLSFEIGELHYSKSLLATDTNSSSTTDKKKSSSSSIVENGSEILNNNIQIMDNVKDAPKPKFWRNIFSGKAVSSPNSQMVSSKSQTFENEFLNQSNHGLNEMSLEEIEAQINIGKPLNNNDEVSLIQRCEFEQNSIPSLVRYCVEYIESDFEFLKTEGLYRKSASKLVVETLESELYNKVLNLQLLSYDDYKNKIDSVVMSRDDYQDCHVIASVLKRYLRKLPIPVIPFSMYDQFISIFKQNNVSNGKPGEKFGQTFILTQVWKCIQILPREHLHSLTLIIKHINYVSTFSGENLMTLHNLCLVFAPGIIRDFDGSFEISDIKEKNEVVEFIARNESKLLGSN